MRPKSSIFYGLLVMAIGILLIVYCKHTQLLSWVVILVGASLTIPCIYTLVSTIISERKRTPVDGFNIRLTGFGAIVASIIGIGVGIWLMCVPDFFIGFIAYAFGAILIIYGIYHLCVIIWLCAPAKLSGGFYIIPLLLIAAGVVILCTNVRTIQSTVILITGIGLVCSGFNSIIEYVGTSNAYRAIKAAEKKESESPVTPDKNTETADTETAD